MKPALKNILATGVLLFLGFHFVLVLNYTAPVSAGGKLKAASALYCYPYFHQQWTVFVPAPQKCFDLMIRNGSAANHSWQAWRNITNHLLKRRKSYTALLGRETEILLMTNAVSYLSSDLEEKDQVFLTRPEWPSFDVLERATRYYFRNFRCWKDGKDYELLLIMRKPGQKPVVYYFKNLSLL